MTSNSDAFHDDINIILKIVKEEEDMNYFENKLYLINILFC